MTADTRLTDLEIRLTEALRTVEELHEMVRTQDQEIAELRRHVRLLLARAAEAEADPGSIPLADQPPPHW